MGQASVVALEGFHKTLCHAVALWTFHGRRYGLEADGFGKFPSFLRCVTRAVVSEPFNRFFGRITRTEPILHGLHH